MMLLQLLLPFQGKLLLLQKKKESFRMMQIVVLQRGWVVVGDVEQYGPELTITDGSVVRRWGTKHGLGELAESGPLESTVLDPAPTIRCHELTVVLRMDCKEEAWARTKKSGRSSAARN